FTAGKLPTQRMVLIGKFSEANKGPELRKGEKSFRIPVRRFRRAVFLARPQVFSTIFSTSPGSTFPQITTVISAGEYHLLQKLFSILGVQAFTVFGKPITGF